MRRILCGALALMMSISFAAFAGCKDNNTSESGSGANGGVSASTGLEQSGNSSAGENQFVNHSNLLTYFENATGKVSLTAVMNMNIKTVSSVSDLCLGGESVEEITVDGQGRYTLKVTGYGGGIIKANNGGTLILKNLDIENESGSMEDSSTGFRAMYADFGGKTRFENCDIYGALQIHGDADVEFVGCNFYSQEQDMYAIWMTQGKALFKDCTFTGYRAIKLYEGSDHYTSLLDVYDVESVTVDGCTFRDISKKPGLAIDFMDEGESAVVIKDSFFLNCQDVKTGAVGVNGIYESRTQAAMDTVTIENVNVDGIPYGEE